MGMGLGTRVLRKLCLKLVNYNRNRTIGQHKSLSCQQNIYFSTSTYRFFAHKRFETVKTWNSIEWPFSHFSSSRSEWHERLLFRFEESGHIWAHYVLYCHWLYVFLLMNFIDVDTLSYLGWNHFHVSIPTIIFRCFCNFSLQILW